ncbi:sigma 54-interacting transcriptional regulator, partial [Klebsiella variicola]|uniref:sigma 54-interacting transcriptional regulator n=1 Tax=Klebsiella variicola TaxID=244366 RepID=UPI003F743875
QEKLLRVIEYGELERVGGSQPLQVKVRLVCATNADQPRMVEEGHFRADLLDRLAFDVVQLPPVRERQSDIMLLARDSVPMTLTEDEITRLKGINEDL